MPDHALPRLSFNAGTYIFKEGDVGDVAYLIDTGSVMVTKQTKADEETSVAVLQRGEILGEMALIDEKPRAASAKAVEDVVLLVIPRAEFEKRLKDIDPIVQRLIRVFTGRLRQQTDRAAFYRVNAQPSRYS